MVAAIPARLRAFPPAEVKTPTVDHPVHIHAERALQSRLAETTLVLGKCRDRDHGRGRSEADEDNENPT
jgi:hypothetical protein